MVCIRIYTLSCLRLIIFLPISACICSKYPHTLLWPANLHFDCCTVCNNITSSLITIFDLFTVSTKSWACMKTSPHSYNRGQNKINSFIFGWFYFCFVCFALFLFTFCFGFNHIVCKSISWVCIENTSHYTIDIVLKSAQPIDISLCHC